MTTQHIVIPLPDRVSAITAWAIARDAERAVSRRTGALTEATVTDLGPLTDQERRTLVSMIDLAITAAGTYGNGALQHADTLIDLRGKLDPARPGAVVSAVVGEQGEDLTRPQELAADAMASEYGRSRVRMLSDGAAVIVGMTDDVERRSVCIEPDGRERWRS